MIHSAAPQRVVKRLEETLEGLIAAGEKIDVAMEKLSELQIVQTLLTMTKGSE